MLNSRTRENPSLLASAWIQYRLTRPPCVSLNLRIDAQLSIYGGVCVIDDLSMQFTCALYYFLSLQFSTTSSYMTCAPLQVKYFYFL